MSGSHCCRKAVWRRRCNPSAYSQSTGPARSRCASPARQARPGWSSRFRRMQAASSWAWVRSHTSMKSRGSWIFRAKNNSRGAALLDSGRRSDPNGSRASSSCRWTRASCTPSSERSHAGRSMCDPTDRDTRPGCVFLARFGMTERRAGAYHPTLTAALAPPSQTRPIATARTERRLRSSMTFGTWVDKACRQKG